MTMTTDLATTLADPQYEALRSQGYTKDAAIRVLDAANKREEENPAFEEWSKDALYARAKELEIPGRSEMNKTKLIIALRAHLSGAAVA